MRTDIQACRRVWWVATTYLLLACALPSCSPNAERAPATENPQVAPAGEPLLRPRSFPGSPVLQQLADAGARVYPSSREKDGTIGTYIEFRNKEIDRDVLATVPQVQGRVFLCFWPECTFAPGALRPLDGMDQLYSISLLGAGADDALLSDLRSLPRLRSLHAGGHDLTAQGLGFLKNSRSLMDLQLGAPTLGDETLSLISGNVGLVTLRLSSSSITDRGLNKLSNLVQIHELRLDDCPITDAGLANLGPLQSLETLSLVSTDITDNGLHHLARLLKLRFLSLAGTRVTDRGMQSLAPLKELQDVFVAKTRVTTKARSLLPHVHIDFETSSESPDLKPKVE